MCFCAPENSIALTSVFDSRECCSVILVVPGELLRRSQGTFVQICRGDSCDRGIDWLDGEQGRRAVPQIRKSAECSRPSTRNLSRMHCQDCLASSAALAPLGFGAQLKSSIILCTSLPALASHFASSSPHGWMCLCCQCISRISARRHQVVGIRVQETQVLIDEH